MAQFGWWGWWRDRGERNWGKKDTFYISIEKDATWARLPANKRVWLFSWNNQKHWTLETCSPITFSYFPCCCWNREMARELRIGNSIEVKGTYWFFDLLSYRNESPVNCRRSSSMLYSRELSSRTLELAISHERSRVITVMMELETLCISTVGRVEIVKGWRRERLSFKRAWWPCRVRDERAIEDAWRPGGKV